LATADGFLADYMWWKVGGKGGLIQFGAADIFTLISILQLKANKLKEQNMYFRIRGPSFVKSTY
jgi:hypothetical protein